MSIDSMSSERDEVFATVHCKFDAPWSVTQSKLIVPARGREQIVLDLLEG